MSDSALSEDPVARTDKSGCAVAAVFFALMAILATLVLVSIDWWPAEPRALSHPAVGKKLPRLQLQPLTGDGEPVSLADLSGQVVLLNFWGTWCPPCVAELPDMAHIERTFGGRDDFRFLAVSCGHDFSDEDVDQLRLDTEMLFFTEHLSMPTYADPSVVSRLAVDEVVGLDFFPTTLVLDREGVIRGVWVGPARREELEALIRPLLEEGQRAA